MTNIKQLPALPAVGYYNECSGALSIIMPQESVNLIAQPSFEMYESPSHTAPTTWQIETSTGATVNPISSYIAVGEKAWSGAASLYSRTISGVIVRNITYRSISVTSDKLYCWSFYIYGVAGTNNRNYKTTIRDTSTNTIYASKTFALKELQWQRVELVWRNISATSIYVGIEKELVSGSYSGGDAYIDACQFEVLPEFDMTNSLDGLGASTYFDGSINGFYNTTSSLPEYAWQGFPHQSTSYRSQQTTHGGRIINLQDELSFTIISVNEANINQPQNQEVTFNTNDGGALLDIVNPKRTITFIGRISGTDKNDFGQKVSKLSQYFSRDVSSIRLPKTFIFQHKDGHENIGHPITFYGAFQSGLNVTLSDVYSANVEISITMYNPYFYGHDEGVNLSYQDRAYTANAFGFVLPSTINKEYTGAGSLYWKELGASTTINMNGDIHTSQFDGKRYIWFGGSFTADTLGNTFNRIARYDVFTGQLVAVLTGATNGVNGTVEIIEIAPNGDVWVGGSFTSAGGVANTGYVAIYRGTAFIATPGQPNAVVYAIAIDATQTFSGAAYPFRVIIGGSFTTIGGGAYNRLATTSASGYSWDTVGTGVGGGISSNEVFSIVMNYNDGNFYFSGSFTTTTSGTNLYRLGKCTASTPTNAITNLGWGFTAIGGIRSLYFDDDGALVMYGNVGQSVTDNIINISTGATTPATSPAYYFVNNVIRAFPNTGANALGYGIAASTIRKTRNGICFANRPNLIWNGTALSGTNFVPYAPRLNTDGRCTIELNDGTVFVGLDSASVTSNPRVERAYNSSTVATKPKLNGLYGIDGQLSLVWNYRNQKYVQLYILVGNVLNAPTQYDYIIIDFVQLKVYTGSLGDILSTVQPSSYITDFTVEPGFNYFAIQDFGQNSATSGVPTAIGSIRYSLYWTQTYQSIFDGINND